MGAHPDAGGDDLDQASIGTTAQRLAGRPRAATRRPRWGLFAGLAAAILVADQLTKAWIVANVDPTRPTLLAGDYLRLIISHNNGALFGLFQGQAMLFALASFAVIVLIVVYHARTGSSLVMSVALGLLLGGAIGNVADRLRYGYVVDFVDAGIGSLRWYTFNVADSAISIALVLLVLVAIRPSLAAADHPRAPGDDPGAGGTDA
jgi:signal peptidase II